jgi:hypothetical protein
MIVIPVCVCVTHGHLGIVNESDSAVACVKHILCASELAAVISLWETHVCLLFVCLCL